MDLRIKEQRCSSYEKDLLMKKIFLLSVLSVMCTRCAITGDKSPETVTQVGYEELSLEELQQSLGVDIEDLGFVEKAFNSCSLPRPLRDDGQCGRRYFSMVHFRVLCRDSVGTTENTVTSLDLRALSKNLEWVIGPNRGTTFTDSDGYGKVRVISKRPIRNQRFVLKSGKTALGLETEGVSRIVVPSNWCE